MSISVEVVGILRDYVKVAPDEAGLCEGMPISAVLEKLGLPSDLVAFVIVNGRQEQKSYTLQPGDQVKFLPFVGGG